MPRTLKHILEKAPIEVSAPCRIDVGGTLDLSSFYLPLGRYSPCTVNMAVNLRTRVRLLPYRDGRVRISSRGFKPAEFSLINAPMKHPLGLMFAVAAYFGYDGVQIRIESDSPPRSGLGGSSVAAVALIAAMASAQARTKMSRDRIALLAHAIEGSVAGVACGIQDQLAAAHGGVNVWYWQGGPRGIGFQRTALVSRRSGDRLGKKILLAYGGAPHASADVNRQWVAQFLSGKYRTHWREIIACTQGFADALRAGDWGRAVCWINRETAIRRKMTPEVLDPVGQRLVREAKRSGCGARFTGAGGGGCIWALGRDADVARLKARWASILDGVPTARLLNVEIDFEGIRHITDRRTEAEP